MGGWITQPFINGVTNVTEGWSNLQFFSSYLLKNFLHELGLFAFELKFRLWYWLFRTSDVITITVGVVIATKFFSNSFSLAKT